MRDATERIVSFTRADLENLLNLDAKDIITATVTPKSLVRNK